MKSRIAGVLLAILFTFGCKNNPSPQVVTPDIQVRPIFEYLVRVEDQETREGLSGATVLAEVTGTAPLTQVTDSNGYARFDIDSSRAGQQGRLYVTLNGYGAFDQLINFTAFELPQVIQLPKLGETSEGNQIITTKEPNNTRIAQSDQPGSSSPVDSPTATVQRGAGVPVATIAEVTSQSLQPLPPTSSASVNPNPPQPPVISTVLVTVTNMPTRLPDTIAAPTASPTTYIPPTSIPPSPIPPSPMPPTPVPPTQVPTTGPPTEQPPFNGTGIELLSTTWRLQAPKEAAEAYQEIDPYVLVGRDTLRLTYNLFGLCALPGDASAIVFDQFPENWHYISLSNYGSNCKDGVQTVDIPLADFGLDLTAEVGQYFHTRFWAHNAYVVEIYSAIVYRR